MARRRPPASTPFGAWLARWFEDHPDWTVEGFATAVRVSPAAVSLWLTKTKRVRVEHLREVARVTGEDFETLYKMVYSEAAPAAAIPNASDLLDAIEERVRTVLRETPARNAVDKSEPVETIDAAAIRRRRAYWIQRARERLAPKGRRVMSFNELADRMGLEGNTRDLVSLWANGSVDPDPAYFERLARALHIPVRDVETPPMTDEERLDLWAREFTEIEAPVAGERRRLRAS